MLEVIAVGVKGEGNGSLRWGCLRLGWGGRWVELAFFGLSELGIAGARSAFGGEMWRELV